MDINPVIHVNGVWYRIATLTNFSFSLLAHFKYFEKYFFFLDFEKFLPLANSVNDMNDVIPSRLLMMFKYYLFAMDEHEVKYDVM